MTSKFIKVKVQRDMLHVDLKHCLNDIEILKCEAKEICDKMEKLYEQMYDLCDHKWSIDHSCRNETTQFICDECEQYKKL